MKYRMVRENRPMLKNYGRWKAVAVHENEVGTARIVKEVCRRAGASRGTVIAVLTELAGVVAEHLREGDSVRLDDVGLLKLEIESQKVDNEEEFRAEEHIRGVRLHVLPESRHGRQALYSGLCFEQVKQCKSQKIDENKGENAEIIVSLDKVLSLEKAEINLAFCSLNRTFARKINNNYARDKTKPNSKAPAKGAGGDFPEPDAHDARRDGERDARAHIARLEHLHGLPEHLSVRAG